MTTAALMNDLKTYVRFDDEDVALLVESGPLLAGSFPEVVDAFYSAIEALPRARAVFADGAQIERQKRMLERWLVGLFQGGYDEAYFEARARIGYAHVRIGLDPALVIAAMNVVRTGLHSAVDERIPDGTWKPAKRARLHRALDRICDIDTAIMVETYRDDYATRIRGTERLAALGQIAGTIGHELRNPLAVMEMSLHLLAPHENDSPVLQRHIGRLKTQVELCASIVRDLMDLSRDRPPNRTPTILRDVVDDALASIPEGANVERHLELESGATCTLDALQFRQLLVNLVTNAIQAASTGAHGVRLTVRHESDAIHVRVEDDGRGIADDIKSKIFEPLFTTRSRGVGFGLALCRRIAEQHGGQIHAENRPEGGARFEATLPCMPPTPS